MPAERSTWLDAPIAQLDLSRVGDALLRFPLVALQLGHVSLNGTDVYTHPSSPEVCYAEDVIFGLASGELSLSEFIARWYCSEDNAREMVARMWEVPQSPTHREAR